MDKVYMYYDKNVEDLSQKELLEAYKDLFDELEKERERHRRSMNIMTAKPSHIGLRN